MKSCLENHRDKPNTLAVLPAAGDWSDRQSALPAADRGQLIEPGRHGELLRHEAVHYSRLHRLQQG